MSDVDYKPNLILKKPNGLQKVQILEEAVCKGTLEDLKDVLRTYKTFELTARALGLAGRYRGIDFVRELVNNGATFNYECKPDLQRKYSIFQKTAAGRYSTEYYLMLVPTRLDLNPKNKGLSNFEYDYTPMYGVSYMNITGELEQGVLPLEYRLEIAKYLSENTKLGVSLDEMLFWALTRNELDFADALIKAGINLQEYSPTYYVSAEELDPEFGFIFEKPTYMYTITSGMQSVFWNSYVTGLSNLEADQVVPVLERYNDLAALAGKRLFFSQKLFDEVKWSEESIGFALENIDLSKINQKKALEVAVSENDVPVIAKLADAGWLNQTARIDSLIKIAMDNQRHECVAWLLDYKNRKA